MAYRLDPEDKFIKSGFDEDHQAGFLYDMHCHTKEGSPDSKVSIEEYICILREKGFSGMLISDHDSYRGYTAYLSNGLKVKYPDFTVLKGIEYDTLDAGHILCIMPESVDVKLLEIRGLPVAVLINLVHHFGGILGPAHPYGEKYLSFSHTIQKAVLSHVMDQFDFVEGFNACEPEESNYPAAFWAKKYGKPVFGGSDAHWLDCVGLGYTSIPEKVTNRDELIAFVQHRGLELSCGGRRYGKTTKDKLGPFNRILVEGFWFYNRFEAFRKRRPRKKALDEFWRKQ